MKQKIFLTSFIAMGVIAPAMAEPSNTGTFPSDGYMEEDYTYTNAATSTNMDGVYEGTVNAVAEYDIIDYIVNAGQYLPADSETVITCPAGSFCPGIDGNVQYNQSTPQGIQTCPTGYASSMAGASSDTQCYRQCSGNVTIAHATGVTGNDYYGNGTDTCAPTSCDPGYHVKDAVPDLTMLIDVSNFVGYIDINYNQQMTSSGGVEWERYGLTSSDVNTWVVDHGNKGWLYGYSSCSTSQGYRNTTNHNSEIYNEPTMFVSLTNENGQTGAQYCYCKIYGYKQVGGELQNLVSSWGFLHDYGDVSSCNMFCATACSGAFGYNENADAYRAAVFASLGTPGPAMCEANTITINWSDVDPEYAGQNNEGTATYGSDVRTPFKAQTKPGQRFKGWRFSKPQTTNLPE